MSEFLAGEVQALPSRGLNEETCQKFNYKVGTFNGRPVQIADYRNADGELVAQKWRDREKNFGIIGDGRDMPLYGQHLWPSNGRRVVITEGEIDALSVAQACGLSWPVVSLPNGAPSAKKAIQRALEWLCGYEQVVLCFDMDEPGRKAAVECAAVLPPGKAFIAETSEKDANAMLKAGKVKELASALWNARAYRPDGIVTLAELHDRMRETPKMGWAYPWEGLSKALYGRHPGQVIGLGAGTSVGKSDMFCEMVAHDVGLGLKVGVLFLEQDVADTGRRIAGKIASKRFFIDDGTWTQEELDDTLNALEASNQLFLYDNFGAMEWDTIKSRIRYMVTSLGVQTVYLDHLTALAAAEDDERKALEKIMAEAASLAKALNFVLHFISHLSTPEGKGHEEGARVQIKQFKGSRAIGFWSHVLLGLERDQQADDEETRSVTTLRVLKDRLTGGATGMTWGMTYDRATGRLIEGPSFEAETGGAGRDF